MTLLNSINRNVLSKSHGFASHFLDPFQDITLSDVEDAAPMPTLLEDNDTEIEVD